VGQQQVVVKSLEANFRKVPGLSGATVMGDGSVAFILDVNHLVRASGRAAMLL
jgi:two-component system chemotaxis sensor kinase CheA